MSVEAHPAKAPSLFGRVLKLVLGALVSTWVVTAAYTWIDTRHELDELLDGHLAQAAAILVVQQNGELEHDRPGLDAPILHRYAPKVAFQVFHEGQLTVRSANAPMAPMFQGRDDAVSEFQTVAVDGVPWRVFSTLGSENDVRVYVGEQLASRQAILWAVLRSTLGPMLMALPLLTLAAWWAVKKGVAPIHRLARTLMQRPVRTLDPVVVPDAVQEMQPMLAALNGLLDRIGQLLQTERRFTADAAHELRTPVATIRMQAEVALNESDDRRRQHALRATLRGCDQAARVIDQLLTLAEVESRGLVLDSPLDLGEVVRRVVADLAQTAFHKEQALEVDADADVVRPGDATLWSVLVRNLVDNAIRYSPQGASVLVTLRQNPGRTRLTVEDSGPGVSESHLDQLGERFFRVDRNNGAGSGLGWSIVRRIAAVHGAMLTAGRSSRLGGFKAEVSWEDRPRDQAASQPAA